MKAVGYRIAGPLDQPEALVDIELPDPVPMGRDLCVEVKAVSVNPVDTKLRRARSAEEGSWAVLGFDAAGVVMSVGPDVRNFKKGDVVFYAGDRDRQGSNAQYQLVDERIVGRKPATLDWAQAAALPLTSITAYEALFERLDIGKPVSGAARAILIIGGAGGVGSIAIQLVRALTDLTVIATASRPETTEWVRTLGAHHVVDHSRPLAEQVAALNIGGAPAFVFSTTQTDKHLEAIVELIAPQGRFALIDDPETLNIKGFKQKSVSIHWEFMFTRALFGTPDMEAQGELLNHVAELVDAGKLRTTLTERLSPINAATLRKVHALLESGTARGKIVVEGFED